MIGDHGPDAGGFDRETEADLLAARLRQAEQEVAAEVPRSEAWQLARQRLEVLVSEFEVAARRWALNPQPLDPRPDATLDERLRRLARARLESAEQIERAHALLRRLRIDER